MNEKKAPSGANLDVPAHLGRKLRELFEAPFSPLPQRLIELLEALAAKDKERPAVNASLKDSLLAMIPNLRAFAVSLCGNQERADDLVQETLLQLHRARHTYDSAYPLMPWAMAIARHVWLMDRRTASRTAAS